MKVRKPTSKRKSTRLEKGISKKVAAHNRKQKKLAKKDVTWKSRKPKDPGIPNSYPFKAQMLEEIEQQRLKDIAEKQQRREQMRQAAMQQGASDADLAQMERAMDVQDKQNRLGALLESAQAAADAYEGDQDEDMDDEMDSDEEELPTELVESFEQIHSDTSRKAFDRYFKQVVDNCDVLIYVLDARNPNGYRSKQVERLVLTHPDKRLIFALNKVDLVPTENLKAWIKYLSQSFPTIPLVGGSSAPNAKTWIHKNLESTATKLLESLKKYASKSDLKRAVTVGVIGYPNVGKSSIINSLLGTRHGSTRSCPTGANAGLTREIKRVKVDNKLLILDSPGIVFPTGTKASKNPVDEHARLTLLNAIPTNRLDDCRPAVHKLVKRLRKDPAQFELFMQYYDVPGLPNFDPEQYITHLLVHVSRKLGRLGKGGIPNLEGAALAIVTDWRDGRISGWSEPPVEEKATSQVNVVSEWSTELNLDEMLGGFV